MARHPGTLKTCLTIAWDFWWPSIRNDMKKYVKGCTMCQATKPLTTWPKPPLHPIDPESNAAPFETIALDFITKLPLNGGYDTILSITDHNCSKVAIFLPCNERIDAIRTAQLYTQQVFPHYGIPKKVISNRDTHFTVEFTKKLCCIMDIKQNMSTAYHPQTDGQSKRSNQWIEQYLWIYTNTTQDDWSKWLPIAQYMHNAWPTSASCTIFCELFGLLHLVASCKLARQ